MIRCSTRLSTAPIHVRLRRGEGGLPEASVPRREQIATLYKEDINLQPQGVAIAPSRLLEVERVILRAIGVPIPLE